MNQFEQFKNTPPPEQEFSPENVKNNMSDYLRGLKDIAEEKQLELNNEEDITTQEEMKKGLEDIETQVAELEETLEFMQEAGDELEIEVGE